jgi:hypothetical protein
LKKFCCQKGDYYGTNNFDFVPPKFVICNSCLWFFGLIFSNRRHPGTGTVSYAGSCDLGSMLHSTGTALYNTSTIPVPLRKAVSDSTVDQVFYVLPISKLPRLRPSDSTVSNSLLVLLLLVLVLVY